MLKDIMHTSPLALAGHTGKKRIVIVAAALLLCALGACAGGAGSDAAASGAAFWVGGRIDLSGATLDKPIALDGQWEFYWRRFVDPSAFQGGGQPIPDALVSLPAEWSSYELRGIDERGYASWRLRIEGLEPGAAYALKLNSFLSAGRVYANGVLIDAHGKPGRSEEEEEPGWYSRVAYCDADEEGRIELVLHVSNFNDRSGGLRSSIMFGRPRQVTALRERAVAYELFVVGAILAMGAYYLGLYAFRRKDRAALWFGLLCIVLGLRVLLYDEYFILEIVPGMDFRLLFVLGYLSFCGGVMLFPAFVRATFPDEYPAWAVWAAGAVSMLYGLIVIIAPSFFSSTILRWYQLAAVLTGLGIAASIALAALRKRKGAGLFGLGFLLIFGAMVHDVFVSAGLIQGVFITQLGLVGFLFALSLNLTRRFAGAFSMAERLSGDLKRVNESLERFVPKEFLGFLEKTSIEEINLGDHSAQDMAVLFADLRGFTRIAERMSAEDTFSFINEYLSHAGPSVRAHGGFIDKYMGDGFMALFPLGAEAALDCALDIQRQMSLYNEDRACRGLGAVSIGMGIHEGPLMLGTIGEAARMDGTVISDVVNTASRLEGVSKEYGLSVATSERILASLPDPTKYHMRFIGKVRVKNKSMAVSVFEIYDCDPPAIIGRKDRAKADFERGLAAYYARRFDEAKSLLEAADLILPGDGPTLRYLNEIARWRGLVKEEGAPDLG
jgi:adenylate cyclase